jgi:hypothetical protein
VGTPGRKDLDADLKLQTVEETIMSLTFIDTNKLPKQAMSGGGEFTEVLNQALCGAQNVRGSLRWLKGTESFTAEAVDKHQLIYVMDGQGRVRLNNNSYDVEKGGGVYLGPAETATIQAGANADLKLFHLVVPKIPK